MATLLPEWHPQEAVILAWPDKMTDWQPWLNQAQTCYLELISAICSQNCLVILLVRPDEIDSVQELLDKQQKILLLEADYNDTWVRDYGFLTCKTKLGMQPLEFVFNGWGNKFDAAKDNLVNRKYLASLCQLPLQSIDLVCEGGALEMDGNQQLLSTQLCLTNPERNGEFSLAQYADAFTNYLGAIKAFVLTQGHLEGDDTDGHIDTLVRFTPDNGLVVQSCHNRPEDSHFDGLSALLAECKSLFPKHSIYSLPLPRIFDRAGMRLPASYANYLINNQQLLLPIYQQPEDQQAIDVVAQAYPDLDIVPINALPLVHQFGSIHCISMQVPTGTLKSQVFGLLQQGLARWDGG